MTMQQKAVQLGFLAMLLAIWYAANASGAVHRLLLPTIPSVWSELVRIVGSGAFWPDLEVTLTQYGIAIAAFLPLGLLTGFFVSRSRFRVRTFGPLFSAFYAVPALVLLPIFVLYFGVGMGSKIAVGIMTGFFPIVLNTIAGFSSINPLYILNARSMGASEFKLLWSVMVPAALPVILNGMRIGLTISFLAILGTETIISTEGLGHRIVTYAEMLNTPTMYAYIVIAIAVAATLNYVISFMQNCGIRY